MAHLRLAPLGNRDAAGIHLELAKTLDPVLRYDILNYINSDFSALHSAHPHPFVPQADPDAAGSLLLKLARILELVPRY